MPAATWMIWPCSLLLLILLVAVRSKHNGRSALYLGASKVHQWISLGTMLLPAAAVIEELPERFGKAWEREKGGSKFEVIRSRESA